MLLAQSGMAMSPVFSQLFRGGCCANCVLHEFSRVFLMLARQIVVRLHFAHVLSSISARVSVEQPKFAFSSCFMDESAAASDSDSIRILSMILAF